MLNYKIRSHEMFNVLSDFSTFIHSSFARRKADFIVLFLSRRDTISPARRGFQEHTLDAIVYDVRRHNSEDDETNRELVINIKSPSVLAKVYTIRFSAFACPCL